MLDTAGRTLYKGTMTTQQVTEKATTALKNARTLLAAGQRVHAARYVGQAEAWWDMAVTAADHEVGAMLAEIGKDIELGWLEVQG